MLRTEPSGCPTPLSTTWYGREAIVANIWGCAHDFRLNTLEKFAHRQAFSQAGFLLLFSNIID